MMKTVDARGYSCPEPVLMTKNALQNTCPLTVLVDNKIALGNITRFAENAGYQVSSKPTGDDFEIIITKK